MTPGNDSALVAKCPAIQKGCVLCLDAQGNVLYAGPIRPMAMDQISPFKMFLHPQDFDDLCAFSAKKGEPPQFVQ